MQKGQKMISYFSKEERSILKVLSFGTFLEYFDVFLFIHLATEISSTFFDIKNASSFFIVSLAYLTTNLFRPLGAFVLGYLGDKIGRVFTLYLTMCTMGFCSLGMAILPSYAQIGIFASIIVSLLRGLQSISSMGEITSARVFIQEHFKGNKKALACCILAIGCFAGGHSAVLLVQAALDYGVNFRWLFVVGFVILLVGLNFRKFLFENREFTHRISKSEPKISLKLWIAAGSIVSMSQVLWSLCYIVLNQYLRDHFNYSNVNIIDNNAIIGWAYCFTFSAYFIANRYPASISLLKNLLLLGLICGMPLVFMSNPTAQNIVHLQFLLLLCAGDPTMECLVLANTHVKRRVLMACTTFALPKFLVLAVLAIPQYLLPKYGMLSYTIVCAPMVLFSIWGILTIRKIDLKNPDGLHKYY